MKPTAVKQRVEMNPPVTALVKGDAVNVRGQPSFMGEVLGHLQNGATVTVLEEITLNHPPAGEPPQWCKIVMPTNVPAWVKSDYIDPATKSVKVHRVNLRGGPGENYSVVGRLEKGAAINELREEKGWVAIEAPTNAYAFVAAELLGIQAAAPPPEAPAPGPDVATVTTPAAPVPAASVPATIEPAPAAPVAPAPTPQAETDQELAALRQATATEPATPAPGPAPAPVPPPAETAGPRIVTREGFVHKSYNIQSPADYELHDIKSGSLIEYLQPQAQQDFKIYVGTRVTVTGAEVIDQRWPRTPVLQVQSVDLMP
jgi:SH3-like domain-containing protein